MSTPYIGSKISLISKSEIRYEGILYTVDPVESTIALAKVRTFGTESRTTDHPTPARDEIFEYIIFKATDIKDIVVCETPQPVPQLYGGLAYDPAIVSVSKQRTSPQPGQQSSVDTQLNTSASKLAVGSGPSSPSVTSIDQTLSPTLDLDQHHASSFHNKAPGSGRRDMGARGGYQQQRRGGFQSASDFRAAHHQQHQNDKDGEISFGQFEQDFGGFRSRDMQNDGAYGGRAPYRRGNTTSNGGSYARVAGGGFSDRSHQSRGGGGNNANLAGTGGFIPRGGSSLNRSGAGRDDSQSQQQRQPRYDGDYDFETANERFAETLNHLKEEFTNKTKIEDGKEEVNDDAQSDDHLAAANAATEDEEKKQGYNKTKSFFDNISCESLERMEGANNRNMWRRERDLNQETFGQIAYRNYQYRRGVGGGRGTNNYRRGSGYNYGGGTRSYNRYR